MAKFCINCGTLLNGKSECPLCGEAVAGAEPAVKAAVPEVQAAPEKPLEDAPAVIPVQEQAQKPAQVQAEVPQKEDKPEDKAPPRRSRYAPVSTFGFLITLILLCIPVLNLVLLMVWARKGCRRVNRRNFARAVLLLILLVALAAGAVYFFGDVLFGDLVRQYAVQLEQWGLGSLVTMWG